MKVSTKILLGMVCVASSAAMTSCMFFDKNTDKSIIEYLPVQEEADGDWSFINEKGEVLLHEEFSERPSAVVEGLFSVKEKEGYTLYKFDEKKPAPVKDCEELVCVGYSQGGLIPVVKKKSRITVVNAKGETVFTLDPVKGKEITYCADAFSDGMLKFTTEEGLEGFVNEKGEVVIEPKYAYAYDFNEGYTIVRKKAAEGKEDEKPTFQVINKKGEVQCTLRKGYSPTTGFKYDRFMVEDEEGRYAWVNKEGELNKLPTKVKYVSSYTDKLIIFGDGESKYGMMNYDGEVLIRAKYAYLQFMDNGNILANKEEDKAYILDEKGEEVKSLNDYEFVVALGQFGIFGKDGKNVQMLTDEGEPVKKAEFRDINTNTSACYSISSDYFSYEALADAIAKVVTKNGVGKYRFGATARSVIGGEPSYSETYTSTKRIYGYDDLKGYRFYSNLNVNFTQSMADYSYDYYSYSSHYYWNSNSVINMISVNINAQTELGKAAVIATANAMKKNGFKTVTAEGKPLIMMRQGNVLLVIGSKVDSTEMEILLINDSDNMYADYLKENVKSQMADYEKSVKKKSSGYDEKSESEYEEEAVADTAVAW